MANDDAIRREWEALNKGVEAALPQEEAAPEITEQSEETVKDVEVKPEPKLEPIQTRQDSETFRQLRESKRELERKYEELARRVESLSTPKPNIPQDYDIGDEDVAMGSHVKRMKEELNEVRKELATEKQERTKVLAETRLRAKYPDVYDVVNEDNFRALMDKEPEEAQTILSDPNPYTQHVSAYKAIKRYGIGVPESYLQDKARAQANMAKPKSAATVSPKQNESPLGLVENYYGPMSSEEKARLRKETEDAINGRF